MLLDLVAAAVLVFFGHRILGAARLSLRGGLQSETVTIVRGLRLSHFLRGFVALIIVATVAYWLMLIPGLDVGWWTAIGGTGNPVTGGTEQAQGTPLEWILPLAFLLVLLPALPLLAHREERIFRLGDEGRTPVHRLRRGVLFGATHVLVGIPIGVALALSVGGWYFSWRYLVGLRRGLGSQRAGVLESTRSHLAYNATIVVLALIALATGNLTAS